MKSKKGTLPERGKNIDPPGRLENETDKNNYVPVSSVCTVEEERKSVKVCGGHKRK
jgi:hypothetical protein